MSKIKIYYGMYTQTRFFKTLEIKVGIVGHAVGTALGSEGRKVRSPRISQSTRDSVSNN